MNNSAQARYHALESDREQFLSEGRRCAALTLPYLPDPDGLEQVVICLPLPISRS